MKTGLLYIVAVGLIGLSSPALAHHGDADRTSRVIDVTGTVVELKMVTSGFDSGRASDRFSGFTGPRPA